MTHATTTEKPLGVYGVTLYFVVTGFLESIQKYREGGASLQLNPFAEQSLWYLATDLLMYLGLAYLIWHLTWFGRLAGLVFGYVYLASWLWLLVLYARGTPMNSTPLYFVLGGYHVAALPLLLYYLQSVRRRELFRVSLLDLWMPNR